MSVFLNYANSANIILVNLDNLAAVIGSTKLLGKVILGLISKAIKAKARYTK